MLTCMICWWKLVSARGRRGACGGEGVCCGDPSAPPPLSCAISAAKRETTVSMKDVDDEDGDIVHDDDEND